MESRTKKETEQLNSLEKEITGLIKELESFNEGIKGRYEGKSEIRHDEWLALLSPEEKAKYLNLVDRLYEKMWEANELRGTFDR